MSIEDTLEQLGVTINNLTSSINIMIRMVENSQQNQPVTTTTPEPAPTQEETPTPVLVTHDELKTTLIKFNRQDNTNHKKLKQLLKDNGASKVGDLTGDAVQLVAKAINNGDF